MIDSYKKPVLSHSVWVILSPPLRGEGWERVIKSIAKGLTLLAKGFRKRSTDVVELLKSL